jgi:hypothetical protein
MPAKVVQIGSSESDSPGRSPAGREGQVVGVEKDKIVGWAWDAAKPYEPVDVELFVGNLRVGHGSADRFDMDLATAKRGNGMHRFELSLRRLPPDPPPYVVRVVIADSEVELFPAVTLGTIQEAESLLAGTEYIGKVTGIVDGLLCGWVANERNPHEQPMLTLRDGSTNVLTHPAAGQSTSIVDSGVNLLAHRFGLPLPSNILDGRQHFFSVLVGDSERELSGSPIMFGPGDVVAMGQGLSAALERLQQLDRKMAFIQPDADQALAEKRMTARILDRIDMMLNIHRDGIERELAVLRRQMTTLIRLSPEGEPDLIAPIAKRTLIETEQAQSPSSFTAIVRSPPLISYNLATKSSSAAPSGGLKWSNSASAPGIAIMGSGSVDLQGVPLGAASLILSGTGATDPFEFCSMVAMFHGCPLVGCAEIGQRGNWTFTGTTVGSPVAQASSKHLSITYLSDLPKPSGQLTLSNISVFRHNRAPEGVDQTPQQTSTVYLGGENADRGWYTVEVGPRGGLCWMGARAELTFCVTQTGNYQLRIPEARPLVPQIISSLQISVGDVSMNVKTFPSKADPKVFSIIADGRVPQQEGSALTVRFSFPDNCVRSPMELGQNSDQRPLTMAIRVAALKALGS